MPSSEMISVIMPSFNRGYCIENAIQSFIQQDYPHKELIIIDAQSQDNTLAIIKKYQSHIQYWISEADRGIYDAMNKGIDQAQGDWLYFMGTDDTLAEGVLNILFQSPQFFQNDIIYGNVVLVEEDDTIGKRFGGEFQPSRFVYENIGHQSMFYHKSVFNQIGKFSLKYPALADWAFNIQCFGNQELRKKYFDLDIAYYKTMGFSNQFFDDAFLKDKYHLLTEHLNLEISRKEIYQNLDKDIFSEIYQGSLYKGLQRAWKVAVYSKRIKFYIKNTIYCLLKRYSLR